jgi:hypothetical protein
MLRFFCSLNFDNLFKIMILEFGQTQYTKYPFNVPFRIRIILSLQVLMYTSRLLL